MSAATLSAAAEISPTARGAGSGGCSAATSWASASRDDINLVPLLDHGVPAQPELAICDAFAGLDVVLVAVPWAHEVELGLGEIQALRGLVGHDALFHL